MPNPNRARGAKSKANLRRGNTVSTAKTAEEKAQAKEVQKLSKNLVMNAAYQNILREKLSDGTLHPSVQVMLWYFAFGKPKEEIDLKQPVPVRLIHNYSD